MQRPTEERAWEHRLFITVQPFDHAFGLGPVFAFTRSMGVSDVIQRLRDEFTEMPGLRLTEPQVERLCTADRSTSASALRALVSGGFLRPTPDGSYGRADLVASARTNSLVAEGARAVHAPWRRILCVLDLDDDSAGTLSTAARSALQYATTLAVTHRARITALQVVSHPWSEPVPRPVSDALRKVVSGEPFRGLLDVHVAFGSPGEEVIRVAKDTHADLIVIGRSEGRYGQPLSWFAETLRQAPCPVLIVHPSGRAAVA